MDLAGKAEPGEGFEPRTDPEDKPEPKGGMVPTSKECEPHRQGEETSNRRGEALGTGIRAPLRAASQDPKPRGHSTHWTERGVPERAKGEVQSQGQHSPAPPQ